MRLLSLIVTCLAAGEAFAQQGAATITRQIADSAATSLATLDSLYQERDTTAFISALRDWKGSDPPRLQIYRGIAALWRGRTTQAREILEPVIDSSIALSRAERRDAIRALAESYSRARMYDDAARLYDTELQSLDSAVDSANARASRAIQEKPEPLIEALTSPQTTEPPAPTQIPSQVGFIALLFALFLLPKLLQRFRIPGAITSLLMGAVANVLGWFPHDPTLNLLSTLGIVALFLFAGLEIDGAELRRNVKPLVLHAAIWSALATITAFAVGTFLGMPARAAALLALALVTPSTGFILSSLSSFGLTPGEQNTVRTYAVGSELIALAALFFILQATSTQHLLLAIAAMAGVIIVIPLAFRGFASIVAPHAPRSEFAFLLMVAVVCAYATRLLGVYYLVGAFLVGVAAQRFRSNHPAMSSEKMVDALESFGSVFIPFYFFHAGTEIESENITIRAILIGLSLVVLLVPIRIAVISLHRKVALGESFAVSRRVGSAMVPTLVFTLVILGLLRDGFGISDHLAGALVLYTVLNTTMPAFVLRAQPADFEDVEALPLDRTPAPG
jgi:Kef-type K+ transport system membrane component KefB